LLLALSEAVTRMGDTPASRNVLLTASARWLDSDCRSDIVPVASG